MTQDVDDCRDRPAVEITPEMVEAGADILLRGFVEGYLTQDDRERFAREIYVAMVRKSHPKKLYQPER